MGDEYDNLLDSLAPPKPVRPRGREKFVPANSSWSVGKIPDISAAFRAQFGRDLPVKNVGQGNIHNTQGWDHRNAVDISLDPRTPEGQWVTSYFKQNNYPFNAFSGPAKSKSGKTASTGPHIHGGMPSSSTTQRYAIGTTLGGAPQQAAPDEYDDLLDGLSDAPEVPPLQTGRATMTTRDDVDFDAPLPPIEFKPFDASDLSLSARVAAGGARIGGANMAEVPEGSPNQGGKLVKATVKTDGKSYPNADQLADALLESLGAKEIGAKYKAETGRNLLTPDIGLEELKQGYDPKTGSYSFEVQPTRADLAVINAYAKGGVEGAQAEIMKMRGEVKASDEKTARGREAARETARGWGINPDALDEGNGPVAKGLGDAIIGTSRLINNVGGFIRDPKDSARDAQIIENASAAIPQEKSGAGRVIRGLTGAAASAPRYANPLAPVVAMTENLHRGKAEAVKSGMTMAVPSGVVRGAGTALNQAAPVVRQALARGMGGATNVITDKVTGSDKNAIESFAEGALLPIGKRKFQHRDFGEVVEAPTQSGVPAGKVRVVDSASVEHVIQKPSGTGAGNQRAIPVRSKDNGLDNGEGKQVAAGVATADAKRVGGGTAPIQPVKPPPPVVPIRTRERQTPKSLERAGLTKGTDLTYDAITNKETLDTVQKSIDTKGIDRSMSDLITKKELKAEDTVTAVELIRRLEKDGDHERAVDVADDVARKLTEAGQAVQAASIISKLSPEGVLIAGQRAVSKATPGKKLTLEQQTGLKESAAKVKEAEAKVTTLEQQIAELKMRPAKAPRAKLETLQERLQKAETEARARLAARIGVGKGGQTGASTIPLDIADYAIIGASKLAQKGVTFAKWSSDMVGEFGDGIKPRLKAVYAESYKRYDTERKTILQEQRERSAQRENVGPHRPQEMRKLINNKLDAMTVARKAKMELNKKFDELTATPAKRFGRRVVDVLGLSRALETAFDLSWGLRQGKMALARHPLIWAKGFGRQFKGISEKKYERMISEIEAHPNFKYTKRFKLGLTSEGLRGEGLGAREEGFQTTLADKIPGIAMSQRAQNTMGDFVKFGWMNDYFERAKKTGLDPENAADKAFFQQGVDLINDFTGRGKLPRAVEGAAPLLNNTLFSPRFWASRVRSLTITPARMILPEKMGGLTRPARKEAFKTLFSFTGLVAGQLALAKASGASVTLDPDDPKFLKACWGNTCFDFSAGYQGHIRLALGLEKAVRGKSKRAAIDILGTYARGKESPTASMTHDVFLSEKDKEGRGKDVTGKSVMLTGDPKKEGFDRVKSSYLFQKFTPMTLNDAMEAYDESGAGGGAGVGLASFFGEGATTYTPRDGQKRGTERASAARN